MASDSERECALCDKDFRTNIAQILYEQKQAAVFCDVVMKVCDCDIFAHSNILAAASPYFTSFFSIDLPRHFSQRAPQVIEIQIDGSQPSRMYIDAVSAVVDYIYTGKMVVKETDVFHISEIARIMQMHSLVKFCESFQSGSEEILNVNDVPVCDVTSSDNVNNDSSVEALQSTNVTYDAKTNAAVSKYNCTPFDDREMKLKAKNHSVSTQEVLPRIIDIADAEISPSSPRNAEHNRPVPNNVHDNISSSAPDNCNSFVENTASQTIVVSPNKEIIPSVDDAEESGHCNTGSEVAIATEQFVAVESEIIEKSAFDVIDRLLDVHNEALDAKRIIEPIENAIKTEGNDNTIRRKSDRMPKPSAKILSILKSVRSGSKPASGEGETKSDVAANKVVTHAVNSQKMRQKKSPTVIIPLDTDLPPATMPGKYSCTVCEFRTSRVRDMSRHRRQHLLDANMCFYCDDDLGSAEELTPHMATHTGPWPFLCRVCGTKFRNRTQLNLHQPKHSSVKPFMCDICGSGFKWKHALTSHNLVHSSHKEHLCDVCGYATAHRSQMKAHKLIHSGETLRCTATPDCTFRATKRQNMKYHMLTHTREKPHQCDVCGQSFSLVKNMRRHMMMHGTKRPYKCTECAFCTTRYDKLKEHLLKVHSIGSRPTKRIRITDMVTNAMKELDDDTAETSTATDVDTEVTEPIVVKQELHKGVHTLLLHSDNAPPQAVQIIIAPQMNTCETQYMTTQQALSVQADSDVMANAHFENVQFTEMILPVMSEQVASQVIGLYSTIPS